MLRRRTKPLVAAKPNGPLWIAEDRFRDDRALLVDDDAVAPLSGDNHLSTALCEVLLANPDHIVEKAVYRSCPLQQNGFDCGLFAFGCVLHLLKGLDVSADIFNQQHISKLRESLHAVFTVTDIGSDIPNPRELLSSSFLSSFPPLQSENDCHDDVFLRLLQDLPNNDNDIDAAPDVPDKAPPIELDVVPLHTRLGADPQPESTRHRDNYFTTQFIEVPKKFEDMSKVDLAIDDYEESSGVRLVIARSRGAGSRLYFCASHTGCCFRAKFGRERGTLPIIYKQELSNPFHCGKPVPPKTKSRAPKKRVRDKLEESVDHVIEVKDSTPVSKDVMKAAANIQSVRASYNQAYRAISRAMANGPREKQQASFGLIMSYLKHFQLRNEDSTVKAESDADQRLRRLGALCSMFGIVTTNMSESVNSMVGDARDGSWLECTNDIVRKMMNRICSLREENYGREGVVDKVAEILESRWKYCSNFQVREVVKGGSQFDVFRPSRGASQPETNRLLDVREQTCECGKWQEHRVPCIDAVAYYRLFETQTLQYIMDNHVSEHYKYETVNELLKENIVPVSLDILDQDGVTLPPNRTKRSSGQPRKKRIRKRSRFAHDPDKSPIVCSRCKKRDHNVKTCVAREQLEKQHPAELDLS
ncbi:hypothetical protein IV203_034290 [Nitzschia inconspicua]|uniref:SWIM-type domain-containing protein n=1 Tax=Nitzschia inconspicua TaxID=303405 RepID=A0A9K3M5P3_9STRA|nr:hypothetical protein IV203_034290 [Nitzschia inconspicua]